MSMTEELELVLREAAKSRIWGSIEIELRDGQPVVLRQIITKKLYSDEGNREHRSYKSSR